MNERDVKLVLDLVRPNIRKLTPYVGGIQITDYEEWLKVNQNEFPYPPAPRVIAEIEEILKKKQYLLHRYPPGDHKELKERQAAHLGVTPEQISFGNGSDEVLQNIALVFLGEGARLSYGKPEYAMWWQYENLVGAKPLIVELPDGYTLPIDEIVRGKPELVFFSNPNTPSGAFTPIKKLETLADELFPSIVVDDEAYADFAEDNALELIKNGEHPNLILTRTFSKGSGLAGLRLGYALGHPDVISRIEAVRLPYNVTTLTYYAGLAALEPESIEHSARLIDEVKRERHKLTADLSELGFYVRPSQANFILARADSPETAKTLYDRLVESKYLVRYWSSGRLSDCLRITVGTPEENKKVVAKIGELLPR